MVLDQEVAILARIPELRGFEPDALRLLAFAATRKAFQAGELLFDAGEPADGAIAVLSGSIVLLSAAAPERQTMLETGDLLDEMAMYVETERAAMARAVQPTTVMALTRDMVRRVLVEFPASAAAVRDGLSGRLDHLSEEIGEVGKRLQSLDDDAPETASS